MTMFAPAWLTARPVAHRGRHARGAGVIENTRSAFAAAIAGNFGIECDVQASADGEAMVFHDAALDRLPRASGRVDAQSARALAGLTVTGGSDTIGTLGDLLAQVAGRVPLVVEIKSENTGDLRLTERVAAMIADYPGPVALKSFDPRIVVALIALAPARPRGIVAMAEYKAAHFPNMTDAERRGAANLLHFAQSRPDFLSWHVHDLPAAAPYLCRAALGLPVMTWTVRTPADAAHGRVHADQIVFEDFDPDAA